MKCKICRRRKATVTVYDKDLGRIIVCTQCKKEFYTAPTEEEELEEERRAEFNAELGAGVYDLP